MANSLLEGFYSLFAPINKNNAENSDTTEGVVGPIVPELSLDMTDDELVALKDKWLASKSDVSLLSVTKNNEEYWLGTANPYLDYWQDQKPQADNVIFEAVETFLPIANRKSPEPIVSAGNEEVAQTKAETVRKMLIYLADELRLKLLVKQMTRHWLLSRIGVLKIGWDEIEDQIKVVVVRPDKLILDPNGTVTASGTYTGEYIGEYREDTVDNLKIRFPKSKELFDQAGGGNGGTKLRYIEWWTPKYTFMTLNNQVLGKFKTPHWNYTTKKETVDAFGNPVIKEEAGRNHFKQPRIPYIFLTVFNTGKRPFDDTGLIEQVKSLQDMINKRIYQIDRNADSTNGSIMVNGEMFEKEQASRVAEAMRKGLSAMSGGNPDSAAQWISGPNLPPFVYQSLQDYRNRLLGIFGVQGSTAQGVASQETARGKILAKTNDDSRIGGGISDCVEQVYDQLFNYMVQMMYVYYDESHAGSILGEAGGLEWVELKSADIPDRLLVSVKEGSLIPDDPLTRANQAIDLWSAGAIGPLTLFKRLGDPNPQKTAEETFMWKANPSGLFQNVTAPTDQPMEEQQPQVDMQGMSQSPLQGQEEALSADLLNRVPVQ